MINPESSKQEVKLPLSDWFLIFAYIICIPLIFSLIIITIGQFINDSIDFFFILSGILFVLLLFIGYFFLQSFSELKSYALLVSHYHFVPSWRDLILYLINQIYQIVFYLFIFTFILSFVNHLSSHISFYFILALLASLFFQAFGLILSMKKKKELLATAQESVKPEIAEFLLKNHPNSHQISEFRFADVQVASLFLSAGVLTYGISDYICLISRYFNWSLSDEELIAVLGHEEGHIARNHPKKQYLIFGTQGILRTFRIFFIIAYIALMDEIFSTPLFITVFFGTALLAFFVSGLLAIIQQYRMYIQEIRADEYAGQLVGNIIVADTLKKLPKIIPAPISPGQTDFLGFRISLLRHWDKHITTD